MNYKKSKISKTTKFYIVFLPKLFLPILEKIKTVINKIVDKSLLIWQQVDNSLPRKLNKGLLTCQQGKSPNKTQ